MCPVHHFCSLSIAYEISKFHKVCVSLKYIASVHLICLSRPAPIAISQEIEDDDVVLTQIYSVCYHPMEMYWYAAQYVYKGFFLLFGAFLAWETRIVKVPALSDSKHIGFCIYNVVIISIFAVVIAAVLPKYSKALEFTLMSLLQIFCTTIVLCILFLPKVRCFVNRGVGICANAFATYRSPHFAFSFFNDCILTRMCGNTGISYSS